MDEEISTKQTIRIHRCQSVPW